MRIAPPPAPCPPIRAARVCGFASAVAHWIEASIPPPWRGGAADAGAAARRVALSWQGRGKVPHSTPHGSAPWKLAAPGAAKSQRIVARPGALEVGRAGRGELPTHCRASRSAGPDLTKPAYGARGSLTYSHNAWISSSVICEV